MLSTAVLPLMTFTFGITERAGWAGIDIHVTPSIRRFFLQSTKRPM
jgi:hypothetical protein